MHEARSTIDGRLYTAEEFALQPQAVKLAHRRRRFTCPVCQQPASFRSRSRDGRAACFTAQHTPGCEAASAVWTETPAPGVQAVPEVDNTGAVIVLDWDGIPTGAPAPGPALAQAADPDQPGPARRHDAAAGVVTREHTQRSLRGLLRRFNADPTLIRSTQPLQLHPGTDPRPLCELVVTPDQIGPEHLDQLHLVWGTLATAQHLGDSGAFLRTKDDQGEPTLRLRLTKTLADTVWAHMGWTAEIPAAAGVTFLAGSVLHRGSGDVPFMRLDSTTQLALTPGR